MIDEPVISDDKTWWQSLTQKERTVVVEFVNRCKKNNFAIFDIFKVKEHQRKTEIREHELLNELEQRNKDLSALCVMCPWKSGSTGTASRIHELELQNAELRERVKKRM